MEVGVERGGTKMDQGKVFWAELTTRVADASVPDGRAGGQSGEGSTGQGFHDHRE